MLKASALYIVIIIALVIGVLCSSLIVAAYFYKLQYQKKIRYDQLERNVYSGVNILINSEDTSSVERTLSLFGTDADSVSLKKIHWGLFDIGISKAFIQKDTLYKVFSVANRIDSTKWAAIYLIDEDRPFSLSGKTTIRGDAYIPKAGVQEAYVDNKAYEGDKSLILGKKHTSEKRLPVLTETRLAILERYFHSNSLANKGLLNDSMEVSFLKPTRFINFKKGIQTLKNIVIAGNIVIYSDTTITIDGSAVLKNIVVVAKCINVATGFHGNCQLFATDSISVATACTFDYPSGIGVLRFKPPLISSQENMSIGENSIFNGIIFTYEKSANQLKPIISIGKDVKITGQVYSQGILGLKDNIIVDGSVFTSRFLYKNSFTLFENYLINTTIDSKALSPYYLTSELLPAAKKTKKILQWLETN